MPGSCGKEKDGPRPGVVCAPLLVFVFHKRPPACHSEHSGDFSTLRKVRPGGVHKGFGSTTTFCRTSARVRRQLDLKCCEQRQV